MMKKRIFFTVVFIGFLLGVQIFQYNLQSQRRGDAVRVVFFDVGQGDAAMITTPGGKHILIDGGPDNTLLYKVGQYLPWWERKIDILVLSHPDSDHITGLIELLERYKVEKILTTGVWHSTDEYKAWIFGIKEKNTHVIDATGVGRFWLDNVVFDIIFPPSSVWGRKVQQVNNTSLVMKAEYKEFSVLFTGDLEASFQKELLSEDIQSIMLKYPHHGSSDSLNREFLAHVDPAIAIISVGKNTYGHPSARTLTTLDRLGIQTFLTKDCGDMIVTSNGSSITLDFSKRVCYNERNMSGEKKIKILLIDDDATLVEMYQFKFHEEGYEVEVSSSGVQALELAKQSKHDVILLDVILPEMDGFEVLKQLKEDAHTKDIPVIMLSNLGQESDTKKGEELGAVDYLVKANFTPAQVVAKVEEILKNFKK